MADLDNLFDIAMARADGEILNVMGTEAKITTQSGVIPVLGVFDDPASIGYASEGIRIDGTSPTLFVKSADIVGVQRLDSVMIGESRYWVDRIGPDDAGSRHIYLGTGEPPTSTRRR